MGYIESNNIRIFPSSNRDINTNCYGDNFVTEYNLSSVINKSLVKNTGGFVISTTYDATQPFLFNIGGYFIEISKGEFIVNAINNTTADNAAPNPYYQNFVTFSVTENVVFANINIASAVGTSDVSYNYIVGMDSEDVEKFSTSAADITTKTLSLPILNVTGSTDNYEISGVYEGSKLRLSNLAIDDGRLNSNN